MSEDHKEPPVEDIAANEKDAHTPEHTTEAMTTTDLPPGWKYKTRMLAGHRVPWYASPETQITLVALVCFLCPGMFNALNGLGGGGLLGTGASDASNTALYSTFAVFGFFGGTIVNRLGIRLSIGVSGLGYTMYVSAYLCYKYTANFGYIVFSGFVLGICAGILWSAQGVIMMSYPPERLKGRYIAWFWIIFNLGGVIGGLVPLGQNIHVTVKATVTTGTYVGFIVLTFCGALMALTLCKADDVVRRDGSKVILMKNPTWKTELFGLYETLRSDPYVILLFPMFFCSNWFYTYQFNDFNAARFNTRTGALNNTLYWASQMIGAGIFGTLLDLSYFKRTTRARGAWVALFVLTMVIWGGGYDFQKTYTRAEAAAKIDDPNFIIDWKDGQYGGLLVLYIFYGMYDAIWQTCVYWFMGAITNNGRKLANFAGFYKGIQSCGNAIIWRVDGLQAPYINIFASTWGLLAGSLLFTLPVVLMKIKDSVPVEEDLKFSDETVDDIYVHSKSGPEVTV